MEYTVYTLGTQVLIAESREVAAELPPGAQPHLTTTDKEEAATAVGVLVGIAGRRWDGNEWLAPAEFNCGRCHRPAEPDGSGGFRHAEAVDAAACEVMFGGGMLAALLDEEE